MLRPCAPLPSLDVAPTEERLEAQVEAWRAWSLLVVRRYAECSKKSALWRAMHDAQEVIR
jgi:hypothetical protein